MCQTMYKCIGVTIVSHTTNDTLSLSVLIAEVISSTRVVEWSNAMYFPFLFAVKMRVNHTVCLPLLVPKPDPDRQNPPRHPQSKLSPTHPFSGGRKGDIGMISVHPSVSQEILCLVLNQIDIGSISYTVISSELISNQWQSDSCYQGQFLHT